MAVLREEGLLLWFVYRMEEGCWARDGGLMTRDMLRIRCAIISCLDLDGKFVDSSNEI